MSIGFEVSMIAGKSALQTRQQEMAVTANNISQANNESYHKQTALLANNRPLLANTGYYGTGVHISSIMRNYDQALESSLRLSTTQDGYNQIYSAQLRQLEDLIIPSGENFLDTAIQDFADSLQDVATTPESITARNSMIGNAVILADRFNQEYAHMEEVRTYLGEDTTAGTGAISETIRELNSLAHQVADINDRIKLLEESAYNKQKANDSRDERNELIMKMAELADVSFTETSDYRYDVTLGGVKLVNNPKDGFSMVNEINFTMIRSSGTATGGTATTLTDAANPWNGVDLTGKMVKITSGTGAGQVRFIESNTANTLTTAKVPWTTVPDATSQYEIYDPYLTWDITGTEVNLSNGKIKGLIDSRSYVVDKIVDLDYFARDLSDIINATHRTTTYPAGAGVAYDLDGNPVVGDIFDATTLGSMSVVLSDPRKIGASTSQLETGNGENMINIWDEMDTNQSVPPCRTLSSDSILNYTDRYNRTIAIDVRDAVAQADTSELSVAMFKNSIFNESGVNMDEEMTDMLEIQRSYQAAAKFINTIDGMLGTVMELL